MIEVYTHSRAELVKGLAFAILALASVGLLAGCCNPSPVGSLPVPLIPQHRDWWCWAATTEMISSYYGHAIDQCESANYVHGTPPDCCTGCTGDCPCWGSAWGASIGDVQNNWAHWQFNYTYDASSLAWSEVKSTISPNTDCGKSPIQVVWWWTTGGGHVVTAYGYAEVGDEKYVYYKDPWPPDCEKIEGECNPTTGGADAISTYDAFVNDGSHTWGNSFHHFSYVGP